MVESFPFDNYSWRVRNSRGTGILHPITLSIEPKGTLLGSSISCNLGPWSISLPRLRFYLSYDDVISLQEDTFSLTFGSSDCIDVWLERVNALKDLYPDSGVAERRQLALLGQEVLGRYHCFQMNDLFFATEKNFHSFEILPQLVEEMTDRVSLFLPELFPEFDELHDEEDFFCFSSPLPLWCLNDDYKL